MAMSTLLLNLKLFSSETAALERLPLSKDTSPASSKRNILPLKELKSALSLSIPIMVPLDLAFGILPDNKSSVDSEKATTLAQMPQFSCSTSQPESRTRMSLNGIRI